MSIDLLLAGGGLANGLIAYRLRQRRPDLVVRIVEAGPAAGGNHRWSFHETDLTAAQRDWIAPFVDQRWPGQEVRFPGSERQLPTGYCSISSGTFAAVLEQALPAGAIMTGCRIAALEAQRAVVDDGSVIAAAATLDGRGLAGSSGMVLGYQKFLGREVRLRGAHGLVRPILMDADVPQLEGFRFIYVLPLAADVLLIEDTRYSDSPTLDDASLRDEIDAYAGRRGWPIAATVREELGVLPILLAGDLDAMMGGMVPGVAATGLAAGLFHPVTGYSLPDAVRLADLIADLPQPAGPALQLAIAAHIRVRWREQAFLRFLSRMLFRAADPEQRWRVLARFYQLPLRLIERFYAGRPTLADKVRILAGRPPVPISRALRLIGERSFLAAAAGERL